MRYFFPLLSRLLFSLTCISVGVPAAAMTDIRWVPETDNHGLTVNMPQIDNDVLVLRLAELQTRLKQDQLTLSEQVEQSRMKGKDTVLAAVLPGGLFYAAYKKATHHRAVKQYETVKVQLAEFNKDMLSFKTNTGSIALARAQ